MDKSEIKRAFSSLELKSQHKLLNELKIDYESSVDSNGKALPHPFIKWAGGKGRMLQHIIPILPVSSKVYYEPFLGGGSVFFELSRLKRFKYAILSDSNHELVNCYLSIRNNLDDVLNELSKSKYIYDKNNYQEIRKSQPSSLSPVESAARFIYLNRTCFNGLYRVNSKGEFNTPFGKYSNPTIKDEPTLRAASVALQNADIISDDFESVLKSAKKSDSVYIDPPYIPISDTSKFTSYTENGFSLDDHERLSKVFGRLEKKGTACVLSNSSSDVAMKLYQGYDVKILEGSRNVGGPARYRGKVSEILVFVNCR